MRRRGLERPVPRGERGVSRKTIAQGMSECFGNTCSDYARLLFPFANEAAGAVERPAFPAPSAFRRDTVLQSPGRILPRECRLTSPPLSSSGLPPSLKLRRPSEL